VFLTKIDLDCGLPEKRSNWVWKESNQCERFDESLL